MSKILVLPKCPYCKKKISYFKSMFMKTKGEHNCPYCKCISNVVISRAAYALASLVCVSALLIVVLYSMTGDHSSFLGIFCVLAPFLIFYIVVPFLVRLVPCKDKSAVNKLLDKASTKIPSKISYEKPVSQSVQNPVTLDVEDDFSAKFLRVKSSVQKNINENEIQNDEVQNNIPSEIENISNSDVSFEINDNSQDENISNENVLSENENNDYSEVVTEKEVNVVFEDNNYNAENGEY